jgi:hypothetical protein
VGARAGCTRCGADTSSTAVIGLSGTYAYLDVCEEHLTDLLRNARRIPDVDGAVSLPPRGEEDETSAAR